SIGLGLRDGPRDGPRDAQRPGLLAELQSAAVVGIAGRDVTVFGLEHQPTVPHRTEHGPVRRWMPIADHPGVQRADRVVLVTAQAPTDTQSPASLRIIDEVLVAAA